MIKFKSIPVEDSESLNEFVSEHAPLASKENNDSGISLHNGFFIVKYEDGSFNEKSVYKSNLYQALNTYRNNIVIKTIEVRASEEELKQMFPEMSMEEIKKKDQDFFIELYVSKGMDRKNAIELKNKVVKSLQDMLMAEYEIGRTEKVNIPIIENLLKVTA